MRDAAGGARGGHRELVLQAAVGVYAGGLPLPAEGAQERGGQVLPGQGQGGERQRQEQEGQEKEEKGRIVKFSFLRLPLIYLM